jgi:hypothetical protein
LGLAGEGSPLSPGTPNPTGLTNQPLILKLTLSWVEPVFYRWFFNTGTIGLATSSDSCTAWDIRVLIRVSPGPAAEVLLGPKHNCVWQTEHWSKAHVMSPEPVAFPKDVLVGAIPTLPSPSGGGAYPESRPLRFPSYNRDSVTTVGKGFSSGMLLTKKKGKSPSPNYWT